MAKYIDLKSAIALAKDIIVPTKNGYDYRHRCIDPQDLEELPAADVVERKTGRWISYIEDGYLECPFCGAATNCDGDESELHFCFSCGAELEGVRNDV